VVKGAEELGVQDVTRPSELVVDVKVTGEDEVEEVVGGSCLGEGWLASAFICRGIACSACRSTPAPPIAPS